MFHDSYSGVLSGLSIPPPGLVPELLACRACLATDTKLYKLSGVLKDTYEYLMGMPLTTNNVRTVDRVSHKLLLKFTLGIDTKTMHVLCDDDTDDTNDTDDTDKAEHNDDKTMDIDALTDVLNDFEEITKSLNDDIDLSDNEFNDMTGSTFIDRAKNFNDDVEVLFRGKEMNDLNEISCKNDISDIIRRAFKGKDKVAVKMHNDIAVKKSMNEDSSSTFRDAEEVLNANMNDSLPPDITFNDMSINTNDLNDTDSNLVETFNNFILDHDYLDEKFLLETGDPEFIKKNVISKKTDEDSLLREIIPKTNTNKDKKLVLKEETKAEIKPVKNLSKLKEINKRSKQKIRAVDMIQEFKAQLLGKTSEIDTIPKPIVTKPELPTDDIKTELSQDFLKFGTDFNFRVFELTREEQLEELQRKRESVLYLGAPYKCSDCAKGFRSAATYGNHMVVHSSSYGLLVCEICHSRHKTEARRRRHTDTHRLKYCCTQCEFVARSRDKAESHYEWHAGKTFSCQYCGEQFGKASTHLSHVRLQHPAACAWCALCGEAFVGALGLRMHTRRSHPTEAKPQESVEWYCFTCRVQFRSVDAFSHHKAVSGRSCLAELRPCVECGDNLESEEALAEHRRRSHSAAPAQSHAWAAPSPRHLRARRRADKRHMCELCGNKYHSAAALSYHQRSHTGERPFACPRCPKSFALHHSLQAHIRTHTGERPYRCSQCARAFPNANNLSRHKKTVHLGQKQYSRCSVCLKWFSTRAGLRAHAAAAHGPPPPPPPSSHLLPLPPPPTSSPHRGPPH